MAVEHRYAFAKSVAVALAKQAGVNPARSFCQPDSGRRMEVNMIATIQVGNSDNKLTQQEWSEYVAAVHSATTADGIETHFFGSSEGSKPWQNACWVVSIQETKVAAMFQTVAKIRKQYKQDSVAIVLGDVRMI